MLNNLFHSVFILVERLPDEAGVFTSVVRHTFATGLVENVEFRVTVAGSARYAEGQIAAIGANDVLRLLHDATNRCTAEQKVFYPVYL